MDGGSAGIAGAYPLPCARASRKALHTREPPLREKAVRTGGCTVGSTEEKPRRDEMSLYYVQKMLYQLNRDPAIRKRFEESRDDLLAEYQLTDEERDAIVDGD